MIKIFLIIYLNICASILLHEFGHYITAKILNYKIVKVILGDSLFSLKIRKLSISPFILSGEVSAKIDLDKTSVLALFLHYFAGIYYQLIFQGFIMLYYSNLTIIICTTICNLITIISSLIPFLNSDITQFIKLFKMKKALASNH